MNNDHSIVSIQDIYPILTSIGLLFKELMQKMCKKTFLLVEAYIFF